MWRQRMVFDNGVENLVGTPKGGFRRQSQDTIFDVINNDYIPVESSCQTDVKAASTGSKMELASKSGHRYRVDFEPVDPSADDFQILMSLSGQMTRIAPYDDADYYWAKIENGDVKVIHDGKVVQTDPISSPADLDITVDGDNYTGIDDWYAMTFEGIMSLLEEYNVDVQPVMVHN
jgi:hypothetical protein